MRKTALQTIYSIAKTDPKVLFIGSDLGPDVMADMKETNGEQFFMEGIAEQHIIGMSAGLALEGFIPFVNTIATFITRRCYEQIAIDLCQADLQVRLIANGGGGVYAPLGPTHTAYEDIALMRILPNMTVVAPCDANEMSELIYSSKSWLHQMYIRLGKGGDKIVSNYSVNKFQIGKAVEMAIGHEAVFVSTGITAQIALDAASVLNSKGYSIGVIHFHTIKPLDESMLSKIMIEMKAVVVVEEHFTIGGLGSAILEYCSEACPEQMYKVKMIGVTHRFPEKYGSQEDLLKYFKISVDGLVSSMAEKIGE